MAAPTSRITHAILQRKLTTSAAAACSPRTAGLQLVSTRKAMASGGYGVACGGYGRVGQVKAFSSGVALRSEHAEETFEEFTSRYEKEFDGVKDVFDLQRNLNNAFAYDLVPSPSVCVAALKAARRVNDFPTAVRIFEGLKAKTENQAQYEEYLAELKPLREELGVVLKEDMFDN